MGNIRTTKRRKRHTPQEGPGHMAGEERSLAAAFAGVEPLSGSKGRTNIENATLSAENAILAAKNALLEDELECLRAQNKTLIGINQSLEARNGRLLKAIKILKKYSEALSAQVGDLCTNLTQAYSEVTDNFRGVRDITRFETLLKQETRLEDLLETGLEEVRSRLSYTNIAVFLPVGNEWQVSAFVNADIPKATCQNDLDLLADSCENMIDQGLIDEKSGDSDQRLWILDDRVFRLKPLYSQPRDDRPCELLGALCVFRKNDRPFTPAEDDFIRDASPVFAKALERVVRIHHRGKPGFNGLEPA